MGNKEKECSGCENKVLKEIESEIDSIELEGDSLDEIIENAIAKGRIEAYKTARWEENALKNTGRVLKNESERKNSKKVGR